MATNGGRIEFQVGLNVDTKNLDSLKQSLLNIQKIRPMDFSGSKQELNSIKQTATQVEAALKNAFNVRLGDLNVGQFNTNLQKLAGGIDHVYSQFSKLGPQGKVAFSEIAKNALTANFQLKETHSIIQQMGTTLVNTIKWNIASSAINSFTQGVQSAFTYVKSLDAALTDIRIVTGDSQEKMQQFAQSANKAAQSLGRSTMDYTKSALTFYQQGLSDEDVQARTEAVLKAQNITGTGAEMADYMTAVWNGYKVANEQAELYIDKLAAVADSSASDMSQLAIAMSRVASTANNMGVSVDQLNAQIATVVATTRQAPEAVGTAFKTIFTRLNDIKTGADEAEISLGNYSGKMAQVGFNVLDANGKLRDTGQIMEEIGNRWGTLTKEQQIYLASTMGGQRQVNYLISLFDNWTTYSDLLNTSLESEGTLAEKNSRYMESLGAKMNQLAAAQEKVKSAMVDTDSWKAVLQILTTITNLFGTFVQSIGGGGNALLGLGSILMQVFNGAISQELTNIVTNLKTIKENERIKAEDIQTTKLFGMSQGYEDGAVKAMVDAKAQIQQYYSFISAEEANAYNQIVKQLGATQQQVTVTQGLVDETKAFGDALNSLGDKDLTISDKIATIEDDIRDAQTEIKNFKEAWESVDSPQTRSIDKLKETFSSIYSDFVNQTGVDEQGKALIKPLQELKDLLDKNSTSFSAFERAARNAFREIREKSENYNNLQVLQQDVLKAKAAFQQADGAKEKFLQQIQTESLSRSIVNIASATTQLAAGFNSIKNLSNIWSNEALSGGEKFLQTITSLAFAIPSLVNGFGKLKKGVSEYIITQTTSNLVTEASTAKKKAEFLALLAAQKAREGDKNAHIYDAMAKNADTVATLKQTAADQAEAVAATNAAAATTALTMAITAGLAIFGVATIALQKYKQHIDEVKKAAEDFKEKTKDIAQNNESNKNTIEELKQLEDQYNKLSEKAGKYDANISNLTDSEKARWDEIKNKLVSINPEILGAYGAQGQAILNNNDALKETIKLLEEKNTKELESYVNSPEFKKAREGRKQLYKQQKREVDNLESKASTAGRFTGDTLLSWQSLTNKEDALGVSEEDTKDIKRLDELRKASLQELAANREQYDAQFKELLAGLKQSNNDDIKRLVAANEQKFLEAWNARVDIAGDLAAQMQAAKDKLNAVDDANPQAIMMELMVGKQDSAGYKALQDAGVKNAQSYILAYLQGHKEGRINEEPQLKEEAKNFEDQLLNLFKDNENLQTTLQKLNEQYKNKVFKNTQERVQWIAEAINNAMADLKIDESNREAFITVLNSALGLNLTDFNFDFSNKEGNFVKSISDSVIFSAEKARQQILAKTGQNQDAISLTSLLHLGGAQGELDWNAIAEQIAKCDINSDNWLQTLLEIIAKQNEIKQNQSMITSLSSITQTGEKLQSGQNVSAKDETEYRKNLDAIITQEQSKPQITQNQQLIKDAELLKQTWLAGSEQYEQALARVQRALIDTALAQAELEGRSFTDEQLENIQKYATTVERVQDLWSKGAIKDQVHYHALLDKAIAKELKTLKKSPEAYKLYYENLKKTKTAANGLGEEIELTDQAAKEMAINDFKLIDSLENLQKSYKKLKDDLSKNPQEDPTAFFNAFTQLASIINNIPGIHIDLTEENATEYLQDIKDIAEGVDGAIEKLRQKLASQEINNIREIKLKAGLDEESVQIEVLDKLNSMIQDLSPQDIETHAYLQNAEFVNQLNALITDCGLTANQCNAILSAIGVKAKIDWQKLTFNLPKTGKVFSDATNFVKAATAAGQAYQSGDFSSFATEYPASITYEPINSSGGDGGVSKPSGGSGGGGGGGGGDKGKTLSKKDQKKEDLDPYHDINRQLEKINKQYSLLQKNEEKLIGTGVIDNLNEQNELLDKNIDLLKQKYDIGEEQRKKKAEPLEAQGVEFDAETGEVTNYNEIRKVWLDQYNEFIKEWNKLAEQQTVLTEEQKKEKEEELKEAQKELEENKKNLEDYINHLDTQADVQLQIKEEEEKKIQNEIKKFKIKIDLHIDFAEAEREWIDFEDKVINQLRDDDIFGNIESRFKSIGTYFETPEGADNSLVQHLTEQVTNTMQQINKMQAGETSDIYGNNIKQATQDLNNYNKQLQDGLKDYISLLNEVKQAYFDLTNAAQQAFDMQEKRYSSLDSWLEHDKKLLELVYGEKAYDKTSAYDEKIRQNNNAQIAFHKQQKDFWWARMQEEKARMETLEKDSLAYKEAADRYREDEKHWIESANSVVSAVEKAQQAIIDTYNKNIERILDDLDKKLTGGKGLQKLKEEWQLATDIQDDYFDNVDKIYQTEKLENAVRQALKENQDNPKAQKALNKFLQDEVDLLKEKDKLTQYDIDHANKALEIEQKRIALQDSRNNKTKLRLKRDAAGNYSYQFVADETESENKLQELKDLKHQLYTIDKEKLKEITSQAQSVVSAFKEGLEKLYSEGANQEQIDKYFNNYQTKMEQLRDQEQTIRQNSIKDMWDSVGDTGQIDGVTKAVFDEMSESEQDEFLGKVVPGWKNGITEMMDAIAAEGGLVPVCQDAMSDLNKATADYKAQLAQVQQQAGISFEQLGQGIDDTAEKTQELITENEGLISTYEEAFSKMGDYIDQVGDLADEYDDMMQAAIQAAEAVRALNQELTFNGSLSEGNDSNNEEEEESTGAKGFIKNAKEKVTSKLSTGKNLISKAVQIIADPHRGLVRPATEAKEAENDLNVEYDNENSVHPRENNDRSNKPGDNWDESAYGQKSKYENVGPGPEDDINTGGNGDVSNYKVVKPKKKVRRISRSGGKSFATGGYTGEWGNEGKLAILHEKQLVLNKDDTANILSAVDLVRTLSNFMNSITPNFQMPNIPSTATENKTTLDQNVHITATFPNVQDHNEIEQALNNLINRASQYAFNTDK